MKYLMESRVCFIVFKSDIAVGAAAQRRVCFFREKSYFGEENSNDEIFLT